MHEPQIMGPIMVLSVRIEIFAQQLLKEEYNTKRPEDRTHKGRLTQGVETFLGSKDFIEY